MITYFLVNVENLKLYEPPMIMDPKESGKIPSLDDFSLEYLDKYPRDIIQDRRTRTSKWGYVEYLQVGFKGMHPRRAQWTKKEKVREKFHHLHID